MTKLSHALAAAASGIPVFPVEVGGKRPLGTLAPQGLNDATTDAARIQAWWAAAPEANIGGAVAGAGLLVVDVDPRHGGGASLVDAVLDLGSLPATRVVATPSGGKHYYMLGEARSRVAMLPGLDVRGAGGYVLLPGSETEQGAYTVLSDLPAAPAPASWLTAINRGAIAPVDGEDPAQWLVAPDLPANVDRATRWLRHEIARDRVAVEGEGGDLWTVKTAAMLRDFGLSPETALALLEEIWNPHCEPPWDHEDLALKVANAYRYAKRPAGTKASALGTVAEQLAARARAERRQRFTPLTWPEVDALSDPSWLVASMLPEKGLSLVYGPPASGKSFLALSIALAISAGLPVWGLETGEPRDVLYVAGEGAFGIRKRIRAWLDMHPDADISRFRLVPAMPHLLHEDQFAEFAEAVLEATLRPALVVLDTVARAFVGGDENTALDMGRFIGAVGTMQDAWRCHVMLVHHSTKGSQQSRGSGALPAAVETELRVEKEGYAVKLIMQKQKDAEGWTHPLALVMRQSGPSLVPVLQTRAEEDTSPEARERLDAQIDAALDRAEEEEKTNQVEKRAAIVLAHLAGLAGIPGQLPVSTAALARQLASEEGENPEFWRSWLRAHAHRNPELALRVEARDSRRQATFFR